jgi:hypothetical protein
MQALTDVRLSDVLCICLVYIAVMRKYDKLLPVYTTSKKGWPVIRGASTLKRLFNNDKNSWFGCVRSKFISISLSRILDAIWLYILFSNLLNKYFLTFSFDISK